MKNIQPKVRSFMSANKKVIVVGAGPGGLTTSMILAQRGFEVIVYEKEGQVGGRNAHIIKGGYKFDIGPTFLMMKFILDEVFEEAGGNVNDYLEFIKLEPMYRLQFSDLIIDPTTDHNQMKEEINKRYPGMGNSLDLFLEKEKKRFDKMYPCLQKPYSTFTSLFSSDLFKALPYLSLHKSVFQVLQNYFKHDNLSLSFSFQTKYLGMSAWKCPAAFSMLAYIEHQYGVYHTTGGLSAISDAMARLAEKNGVKINLKTPVKKIIIENQNAKGVELENGERIFSDDVIINADFCTAMNNLVDSNNLNKYRPEQLEKKKLSCSTFMLYLGIDKLYNIPHHTIVFADDYKSNVDDIFYKNKLSTDTSFYVRNASINDKTLAPEGKSGLYVLVPVANFRAPIDWDREKESFENLVLDQMEKKLGLTNLRDHIEVKEVITPKDWHQERDVYMGATFNLAHNLSQMLFLRPRNKFEEFDHCYLVGGGTHPGSGLPTIYESGRIAANMISKRYNVPFVSKNLKT